MNKSKSIGRHECATFCHHLKYGTEGLCKWAYKATNMLVAETKFYSPVIHHLPLSLRLHSATSAASFNNASVK
jgi:hypothetical protein